MLKAYKYRIYPNNEQKVQIEKTFGCCRFVYNQTLAYRKERYEKEKKSVSKTDCNNYCNRELKKEYEWLKEVDKFALTNAIYNMDSSYQKFFREHAVATKEIYEKPQQVQKKINAELKQTTGKSLGENIIADAFDRILFQTDYRKEAIQGFANISKEQGFIKELPVDSQLYAFRKEEEKR